MQCLVIAICLAWSLFTYLLILNKDLNPKELIPILGSHIVKSI